MKKPIKVVPKKRGRPAVGKDPLLTTRAPIETIAAIESWAEKNSVTKSEAIRRLVEIGLRETPVMKAAAFTSGPTARDLAAAQIDQMGDPAASSNEQETRKRRLLKGPQEFRDSRVDVESRPRASRRRPASE